MTDLLADAVVQDFAGRRAVALLGIGTAVPEGVGQGDALRLAQGFGCQTEGQRAWLKRVFLRSGVERRGSVLKGPEGFGEIERFYAPPREAGDRGPTTGTRMTRYAVEAPALAERAAAAALSDARLAAGEITHLITVSCTGFFAPGLDVALIQRLGLVPSVKRLHVGFMGCHAGFNALSAARDIVLAHAEARVLMVCVELSTLHFAYGWHPEKLVANALFGDGASACVVGSEIEKSKLKMEKGEKGRWRVVETASLLLPASADAMTWQIGDHGFEMTLSAELPALIGRHLRPWCAGWLGEAGVGLSDVRHWAIHPGGPKILGAAAEALGLGAEGAGEQATAVSRAVLAQHGNMSSATLLFLLEAMARGGAARGTGAAPEYCVAIGFGPGLMAEGMLLEM